MAETDFHMINFQFYTTFKTQNWLNVQNLQSYILNIKYDEDFQFPVTQNFVSCNFHYPLH